MSRLYRDQVTGREKIPVGVVGVGYAGRFHAEKYAASKKAELVGVADINQERALQVGQKLGVLSHTDYRELFGRVRCVSIAVPTRLHYAVSRDFLAAGIDVLVEKPMAASLEEGSELVTLAREKALVLQVGHLERFNPAIRRLEGVIREPRFVECHRLAPFVERGTDVDVVLDLMIHDIDVIASLVRSPVERVEAVGVPVLTDKPDIANARITFANGCIANVTASRVSMKRERKIRFFQPDAYISIDYDQRRAQIYRKPGKGGGWQDIRAESIEISDGDALADEIDSFLDSVQSRGTPLVSGEEGLRALEIATMISERL
ncbi:MAG: Gfo/Idh/MocA family oxidoreductase [Deltaproteobacteria bacterium]|nr:Gfo/Idh/MocA family oxidoreductase [Deltaproteobacteria bacterium]